LEFEVVGVVEDEQHTNFAVCYCEQADEFIVTDDRGQLLEDEALAQEILDDFFVFADEAHDGDDHAGHEHPHPH
jgi:hypothetical protein